MTYIAVGWGSGPERKRDAWLNCSTLAVHSSGGWREGEPSKHEPGVPRCLSQGSLCICLF